MLQRQDAIYKREGAEDDLISRASYTNEGEERGSKVESAKKKEEPSFQGEEEEITSPICRS